MNLKNYKYKYGTRIEGSFKLTVPEYFKDEDPKLTVLVDPSVNDETVINYSYGNEFTYTVVSLTDVTFIWSSLPIKEISSEHFTFTYVPQSPVA